MRPASQSSPVNTEPTNAMYDRFFQLSHVIRELTPEEDQELQSLESLVSPWLYEMNIRELAIKRHSLIAVADTDEDGSTDTRWITDRFAVLPEHSRRGIDGHTRYLWAIIPFDEQPDCACSMVFENGVFRREEAELLHWPFHVWVYHSIKSRNAYKQHFGSEFPTSLHGSDSAIDTWIAGLNL